MHIANLYISLIPETPDVAMESRICHKPLKLHLPLRKPEAKKLT